MTLRAVLKEFDAKALRRKDAQRRFLFLTIDLALARAAGILRDILWPFSLGVLITVGSLIVLGLLDRFGDRIKDKGTNIIAVIVASAAALALLLGILMLLGISFTCVVVAILRIRY
ncbi:MAG: hypothetical protein K8T25_05120 [Planctomycetia bacterium]|nr:hypothetical protein [Planctomycetia bacterium]